MARTTKKSVAAAPAVAGAQASKPAAKKRSAPSKKAAVAVESAPASQSPKTAPARQSVLSANAPVFPTTNYPVVERIVTDFIRREVTRVGLKSVVLGLSGGVDSALAAALAAKALGAKNVLGVMMPYKSSSEASLPDAKTVAKANGIETLPHEITAQIDAHFALYPDASERRRGNKMARERITVLYDFSAARDGLVLGTSNKTELLLGYGTLYGDMASALNPIGDLYKTQVWEFAERLGLPKSVIGKAPTADLWAGQTDEQELGFGYLDVDRLLNQMVDERADREELVTMGFDAAFVERVHGMIRGAQFKRRQPIIAKVSQRTLDTDFRYSRDWGR